MDKAESRTDQEKGLHHGAKKSKKGHGLQRRVIIHPQLAPTAVFFLSAAAAGTQKISKAQSSAATTTEYLDFIEKLQ